MQRPLGPKDMYCPTWKKPMVKVCHTCPLWKPVEFINPQTGVRDDRWDCALAWIPGLLLEAAQQSRQGAAATESFRNDLIKRVDPAGYAIEADEVKRLS